MPDQLSGSDRLPAGNLARVVGVVALAAVVVIHISPQALIVLLAFGGLQQPRLRRPGAHSDIDAQDSLLRAPADFTG